ncbi:hypothetical protein RM697_12000 [Ichthyenterobacterium sp. W332]|uniref:O-antigen ligase family protein n=1 Tax=Microcosmobacter mediterraneus TaxID=3075607 RepID=A0ABU2YNV9_9FLAO|nr:hypothetical protein [Ichthyenterobacterium sp. W332]MDT0559379.1 hypothetical protein [Ichthyenterobacterium sp. W332]
MILIPLFILCAIIFVRLKKGLFSAFLLIVASKSIFDAFWDIKFGPLSMLSIQGVLITALFFNLLFKRKFLPRIWLRTADIYIVALSLGVIWSLTVKPISFIEIIIVNVNIYMGFIIIPLLVNTKKQLKQLLIAMMVCGVFPIIISIYQLQTGIVFNERETIGLTRYVGFYHDAFPVRFYGLMTILSLLLYQTIFDLKGIFYKGLMIGLASGAFISIYAVFSKAAVVIMGSWIILLLIFSKSKLKQFFSLVVGISVIFIVFGDVVLSNIEQLFSKEVGYQTGEVADARYALAGRGYIWEDYWNFWANEQLLFFQWFGDGINRPVHNEFFRILLVNGILGLLLLILFLLKSVSNIFKVYKKIRVFSMMILTMYLVDCVGLVPGTYYYYNILIWGIFGLLILNPNLFSKYNLT